MYKKNLKQKEQTNFFNDESKIPAYNDDDIKNNILKVEEENKKKIKDKERKKKQDIIKEKKKNLIPIKQLNFKIHLFLSFLLIMCMASLIINKNFFNIIYTSISIIITYMITRRLNGVYDEVDNITIWNISQSIYDFINIKLGYYDFFKNTESILNITSLIFMICSLFFLSSNIIYLLSLVSILFAYIITFANRKFELLLNNSNLIIIMSIVSIFVKSLIGLFTKGMIFIDYSTVIIFNLFYSINYIASIIDLLEPEIDTSEETINDLFTEDDF